ncbi:MAG: hypothetical protein JNL82_20225 [Myxococcales bacterium]|nr:hypothetical protein [Myxococcales bacterium]
MRPHAAFSLPFIVSAAALLGSPRPASAAEDDLLVEFHYNPVADAQIALWIEDRDGKFAQNVLVTQATGKLGIGNRPGVWNFVGSWRAPYGPRVSVLPIWAHRRNHPYPKVVFFDDDPGDENSLGWHENTSTAENYFCRPLTADEHEVISVDTMTCPSPNVFQTDKGRFAGGETSPYPPRNDLVEIEAGVDSPDAAMFAEINDLDAVTAATPAGDKAEFVTVAIPAELAARAPLKAWIEVSKEHDENESFAFDRETDHFVDQRLTSYGVEYLGQPSVVYQLSFDPRVEGFKGTSDYAGYGDWDGKTGTVHPPDGKISASGGSGADRLREYTLNGKTFRFGLYAYGADGTDTGDDGWGNCKSATLPAIEHISLEGMSFDKVRIHYKMPVGQALGFELAKLRVYLLTGEEPLTPDMLGAAYERSFGADVVAKPGEEGHVEVDQLWGNYTYQIGVTYQDKCAQESPLITASITTEPQQFQTVEGFCFLATAAYGAAWAAPVQALRWFRDASLKVSPMGRDIVRFYYAYSPPLARVIQHQPILRGMVRVVVQPVADLARGLHSDPARG